jgi:hypothetical protein
MDLRRTIGWCAAGMVLAAAPATHATTVAPMSLADLAGRAGRIFRGTVVAVENGSVAAGGGDIPTVTYRIKVDDAFKGSFARDGERRTIEVRMVGRSNGGVAAGQPQHVSLLGDVPALEAGHEYLLFTTTPSRIGLSTTVGLGQGAFRILGHGDQAKAVNAFGNAGLFGGVASRAARRAPSGPVRYTDLAADIRELVGR